ncbi:uncharacterized protein LOC134766625 [Penaeus indicus]|uniref:uncharacterized protein LOC134766625 n=1 Tax=Penaeus indicus TaxID=29960 RepID=UPI00300CAE87
MTDEADPGKETPSTDRAEVGMGFAFVADGSGLACLSFCLCLETPSLLCRGCPFGDETPPEISARIAKASSTFGRLRNNVWERRGISLQTKLKVYRTIILTTLLYGCEAWTMYRRHERQVNHFHLSCLRNLLHIRWQDKVPDTEVLKQANLPSITTVIRKSQLRWAGHVSRMSDHRIPKQLFYGELCQGKRRVGGQRKRYKDSLKVSFKDFNFNRLTPSGGSYL